MTIIALRAARTPGAADDSCRVIPRSYRQWDVEVEQQANTVCARQIADKDGALATANLELARLRGQRIEASAQREEWATLGELLAIRERVPIYDEVPRMDSEGVHIRALAWWVSPTRIYLVFEIHNRTPEPYQVARFEVLDEQGLRDHARRVYLGIRHKGDTDKPARTVSAYSDVRGIAAIGRPADLGNTIQVFASGPRDQRRVVRTNIPALEQARREDARRRERLQQAREAQGRIVLHAQSVGGVTWLYDGGGSRADQTATSIAAAGVRVTYSFNRLFALEVDALGGGSGDASFESATSTGERGVLTRSASFGRMHFGGALRLGNRVIPTLRLGLGAQGTRYRSALVSNQGALEDAGTAFRLDTLLSFGAGLDIRLSDHVTGGLGLSITTPLGSDDLARGVEGGIHLGYGWTPSPGY